MIYSTNKDIQIESTLPISAYTTTGTGEAIDLIDCSSASFFVMTQTAIVGTPKLKFQESDNGTSGWTDIADEHLIGDMPEFPITATATSTAVGYAGYKRYVRALFTDGTSGTWGVHVVKTFLRSTA